MQRDRRIASELTITKTAAQAERLAARMAMPAAWATRIAEQRRAQVPTFGARFDQRLASVASAGATAAAFAERYTPEPIEPPALDMTIAPFAPPLRQISAARQGAPVWQRQSGPPREPRLPPADRARAPSATPGLAGELAALGWGRPHQRGE